jgi:hypothetical protein
MYTQSTVQRKTCMSFIRHVSYLFLTSPFFTYMMCTHAHVYISYPLLGFSPGLLNVSSCWGQSSVHMSSESVSLESRERAA